MPSLVNTTFPGAACVAAATIRLGRDGPDQAASPTVAVTRFPSRRRARSIVAALSIPRSGSIFPSSPLPTSFFRSLTVVLRSPSWSVPREPAPSEATRSGPPEFDASLSTPQTPCGWTLEVSARGQGWRPSPGERSVDAYRLEASDDDGVTWTELADYTGDRTSLRYTMHRGLEPDTTYSYRITPIIGGGAGRHVVRRPGDDAGRGVRDRWPHLGWRTVRPPRDRGEPVLDARRCGALGAERIPVRAHGVRARRALRDALRERTGRSSFAPSAGRNRAMGAPERACSFGPSRASNTS